MQMKTELSLATNTFSFKSTYTDFKAITKAGLAISVVFSSLAGFILGVPDFHSIAWLVLLKLAVGGYCMVGASNAYNQVIEKDLDALMDRTKPILMMADLICCKTPSIRKRLCLVPFQFFYIRVFTHH